MVRRTSLAVAAAWLICSIAPAPASAWSSNVAALQVALRAVHAYGGAIDGVNGPRTRAAVRRFQRRKGLPVNGVAGRRTRRALGRRGRPLLGSRVMRQGHRGWDVAALQFLLSRRGHSPGSIDGGFGPRTRAAVRRFQRARRLAVDGVAGPATIRSLRRRPARRPRGRNRGRGHRRSGPVRFFRPVRGPMGDGFGRRGRRMHTGIDFPVPHGTRVGAAARGVTTFAGWNSGGYGKLVVIRHRRGFETWYAHLSRVTSFRGERVVAGTPIGYVGSTGRSTGPHLHFEVRRHGRPINPMPRLLRSAASNLHMTRAPSRHNLECPDDHGAARSADAGGSHVRSHEARRVRSRRGRVSPATARLAPC